MIPLIDDFKHTSSEHRVEVEEGEFQGFMLAKPLNYDPEYLTDKERREMADAIMAGKAIAVRFFDDFSEEEKREYVTKKIIEANENIKDDGRTLTDS